MINKGRDRIKTDTSYKSIKEIDSKTGEVTFDDGTDAGTAGTKKDCKAYGYNFVNNKCFIQGNKKRERQNNIGKGKHNNITGNSNKVNSTKSDVTANNANTQGTNHEVTEDFATVIGNGGSAIRYGEFVHAQTPHQQSVAVGNRARAQRSVLIYQGRTADNTETEIFLGGVDGKRFVVDEGLECVICFESRVIAKSVDKSGTYNTAAMGKFQHGTFRVTNGALDRLGLSNKTNHNDGISGWTNDFVAVSDTPDYIKATVTGQSGTTIDWTIICYVNEMRTKIR